MHVTSLHVYPVKSTRASDVARAVVYPWGLADDRRWMVVGPDGVVITAREEPRVLAVSAHTVHGGALTINGPHANPLSVTDGAGEPVSVAGRHGELVLSSPSPEADAWFGKLLDREVRLVTLGGTVGSVDGYPLLLTTTASLRQLNAWVAEDAVLRGEEPPAPLVMGRFRPSVVVDSDVPFAEDHWRGVRIGSVAFRVAKGCDRCVMTTIDPDTLAKGKEPIRTLARHRRWDGKVWFGVNLVPEGPGTIAVGERVESAGPGSTYA